MRRISTLVLAGLTYAVVVPSTQGLMCSFGASKCEIGTDLALTEVLLPVLVIAAVLLVIGFAVAWASALVGSLVPTRNRWPKLLTITFAALMVGALPRALWDVVLGVFHAGPFMLGIVLARLFPWMVGGVACGLVLWRRSFAPDVSPSSASKLDGGATDRL